MAWLELLRAEAEATTMQKAGERVGITRTAVSLCLAGKYPAKTDRVAAKVLAVLGQVDCPALAESISPEACRENRERKAPTHNPQAMQLWKACHHCPNNPHCAKALEANHATQH